jgi:hypothetical protein
MSRSEYLYGIRVDYDAALDSAVTYYYYCISFRPFLLFEVFLASENTQFNLRFQLLSHKEITFTKFKVKNI